MSPEQCPWQHPSCHPLDFLQPVYVWEGKIAGGEGRRAEASERGGRRESVCGGVRERAERRERERERTRARESEGERDRA